MGGYDGSINIDTHVDESGFNNSVDSMSSEIPKVSKSFDTMGKSVGASFSKIGATILSVLKTIGVAIATAIGIAVIAAVFAVLALGALVINSFTQLMKMKGYADDLKQSFAQLKVSFAMAFQPLVAIALPIIQSIVNWMIKLFNTVAMVIGALLGQKEVMQAIAGDVNAASGGAGNLAKNTKKSGEAAKGALAAFDQLNVLQMAEPDTSAGGGGAGSAATFQMVKVSEDAQGIADKIIAIWDSIKTAAKAAWDWIILNIWIPVSGWVQTYIIDPIWSKLQWLWGIIVTSANLMWNGGLKQTLTAIWEFIKGVFLWNVNAGFTMFVSIFKSVGIAFAGLVTGLITVLGGIIQFLQGVFTGNWKLAWEGIKNIYKGIWDAIYSVAAGVVNSVIAVVNGMVSGIVAAVNFAIKALNTIPGVNIPLAVVGKIPQMPTPAKMPETSGIYHLAQGAVIPPNSQFAAILGDQRSGRNLEAPEGLIRQIMREEMGNMAGQDVTVNFTGTMATLIQAMNPEIKRENKRIGGSLIVGA